MKNIFTKSFFIVALFVLSTTGLWAKTVNVDEAKDLAHQFLTSNLKCNTPENMKRVSPKASLTLAYEAKAQNGESNLFVFNQGEKGFVIVAGDDCVSPILGYADAGAFDEGNMPEGFRYWLESCSRYVEKAVAGEVKREDMTMMRAQNRSYAAYINPILGDIAFHQQAPYNGQCPMLYGERTIVGCVAISMGQIMTYYQWPKQGQGSYSYTTTDGLDVSADFNTRYDWNNILHYYDSENVNYNSTQKNAVAKMLFHCGVSVNMDYGIDGSGSSDIYVPKALSEYFSYDKGMQVHYRAMYNFNDWKNLIKEELNNNRPIIYCGDSDEGGHAFNCDGYDYNDYFHINWGWGGYYNGYYDLRYLDYEDNDQTAFNRGHSIVTGIKPDKGDGTETKTELAHNLMLTYGSRISDNVITYEVFNMGGGEFVGDIATGVYYNGELVYKYIHYSDVKCAPGYGDSNVSQDLSGWTIDYYEVQPIYRESGSSEWKPIPGENGMLSRWVYYSGVWVFWKVDVPQFRVNSLVSIGDLNSEEAPVFELNFTNTSDFDYYGDVCLILSDDENLTNGKYSIYTHVVVLSQETQTVQISFPDAFAEGEYYVTPWVDGKNSMLRRMFDENGDNYIDVITIADGSGSSTSGPQLELYNYSELNKTDFTFGEELEYTAYIYNYGEGGYGYLSIDAYNYSNEWSGCIASYTDYYVYSGSNTITLSGVLSESFLSEGDYYVRIWWSGNSGNYGHIEPDVYNAIAFSIKDEEEPQQPILEMVAPMQLNKTAFYPGETLEATFSLRNNGAAGSVNVGLALTDSDYMEFIPSLGTDMQTVYMTANSEKTFSFSLQIPNDYIGTYEVLAYEGINGEYYFILPKENSIASITIEEYQEPQPILEMVAPMQLNKTAFYSGETLEATFSLRNNGAAGSVNVGLTLTDGDGLWHPEPGTDLQSIYLSENSTKNLNFSITIPRDYVAGNYSVIAYYEQDGNYYNIESVENSIASITIEEFDGKYDITVIAKDKNGETLGSGRYDYGSEVTIAAIPDYGYKFYRWSDKNKENPRVVTVEGEATYEAEFRAITLSLEAQPNDDAFEFVEWSDGVTDNPRSISIAEESELEYVAIFRMKETAIENAYITSAHVYANSGYLYVVGAEDDYLVFDEVGKLIYSGNETSIQLPSGVYLVRLGKEVQKVVVL